ncbi:MAG: NADH-quinone oxidoreductase subunit J [Burkholderia sp.]|nr:NADH-quinone oxidoreductase subunit J [Burkholderia sp.]
MVFTTVLFYILASILIVSGLRVIASSNPVVATLFLVLAFFNAAMIWMLLEAEFLSIMLVLVYVGAVMVLFLFVVMMLDTEIVLIERDIKKFMPMAVFIGAIIIIESWLVLWHSYGMITLPVHDIANGEMASMANTHMIGKVIYTDYILEFEIVGFILLTGIIAASALTLPKQSKDSKRQRVSEQVKVSAQDRVRIVRINK